METGTGEATSMKTCPMCAEQVQAAAKICRFCGYDFELGTRPAPAAGVPTDTNGKAIASLIFGLLWIFGLGSLVAVVLGHMATREIDRSQGRQGGRGIAVAGLILGWLGLASTLAFILLTLGLFAATESVVSTGLDDETRGRLASDLKNAATAEESYRTVHPRYTRFIGELEQEGLRVTFATLTVVEATKDSYCIEGEAGGEVMHYDSDEGTPADGSC